MKRIIVGIIIVLLIIAVAVEGVIIFKQGKSPKTVVEAEQEKVEQGENEIIELEDNALVIKKYNKPKDDELVYTYLNEEYINRTDNYMSMYSIPQINIDSADAEEINQTIRTDYNWLDEPKELFGYWGIEYCHYTNDNILSLVISEAYETIQMATVYNIDTSTGKRITNLELLEYVGVTEEEFREKLINEIKNIYSSREETDTLGPMEYVIGEYENMSIEEIDLCIDINGNISVFVFFDMYGEELIIFGRESFTNYARLTVPQYSIK